MNKDLIRVQLEAIQNAIDIIEAEILHAREEEQQEQETTENVI